MGCLLGAGLVVCSRQLIRLASGCDLFKTVILEVNYILTGITFLIGIFVGIITITWFTIIPSSEITPMVVLYAAGTIIALSAVVLTLWHGNGVRNHNKLSVKPKLGVQISLSRDDEITFSINVKNFGLGPAIITTAYIKTVEDNKKFQLTTPDLNSFVKHYFYPINSKMDTFTLTEGTIISSGEDRELVKIYTLPKDAPGYRPPTEIYDRAASLIKSTLICIEYKSMYEEPDVLHELLDKE